MQTKIRKEARRNKIVTTRLTKDEFKLFKKLCKAHKITGSWLIRFSIEETLKSNRLPEHKEK